MELYLSLSAYGGVSIRKALTVFWEAGIRHVELAIGPRPDVDALQAIQDFRQQGIVYRAHHAFIWGDRHYPFNLAQPQDWKYFEQLIDYLLLLLTARKSLNTTTLNTLPNTRKTSNVSRKN